MNNKSQCYEFQPPANIKAIRSNIVERIKQRNRKQEEDCSLKKVNEYLDNGLPSPPTEACNSFEQVKLDEINTIVNNISSPSSTLDSPPSPVPSSCSTTSESSESIREKIKLLKQEKHKLFQTMKNLLSEPVSAPSTPITPTSPLDVNIERSKSQQLKARPIIRSRSISHTEFNKPRYYRPPPSRYYRPMYTQPTNSLPQMVKLKTDIMYTTFG